MELTYECPDCGATGVAGPLGAVDRAECGRCGVGRSLAAGAVADGRLSACAACGTEDLYIQKDFPHGLGLLIVVVGFGLSTIFYAYYQPIAAMAVLLATAGLDVLLYYLVPDLTICYRCLGQHRGVGSNPDGRFAAFDLAIGERYRQERLRVEELRARGDSVPRAGGDGPGAGR